MKRKAMMTFTLSIIVGLILLSIILGIDDARDNVVSVLINGFNLQARIALSILMLFVTSGVLLLLEYNQRSD